MVTAEAEQRQRHAEAQAEQSAEQSTYGNARHTEEDSKANPHVTKPSMHTHNDLGIKYCAQQKRAILYLNLEFMQPQCTLYMY